LRVRVRFQKIGKVRFVGHRDLARLFERALRKTGFPVTYSEGFSPRVRMSFGLALPTCYESEAEYLDIPIDPSSFVDGQLVMTGRGEGRSHDPVELMAVLSEALPVGVDVTALELQDRGGQSLQESISSCTWQFDIIGCSITAAEDGVDRALASDSLPVERTKKGKTIREDIRQRVHALHVAGESERGAVVVAELSASPRVIRPTELLDVLAAGSEVGVARRLHQWIECEGARREPLPPATTHSAPAAAGSQEGSPT
jgi:hypothetical protein